MYAQAACEDASLQKVLTVRNFTSGNTYTHAVSRGSKARHFHLCQLLLCSEPGLRLVWDLALHESSQ